MNWESPAVFFAMGGYGFYVWGSFGMCALLMVVEPILAWQRHREALRSLRLESLADTLEQP